MVVVADLVKGLPCGAYGTVTPTVFDNVPKLAHGSSRRPTRCWAQPQEMISLAAIPFRRAVGPAAVLLTRKKVPDASQALL